MRYYRALKDLSNGYKRYELVPATALKVGIIPILLAKGAIGEVTGPPLSTLPGWSLRSERLAAINVVYVHDFLDGEISQLAEVCGVRQATIEKWQAEVARWLQPVPPAALEQQTRRRR